MSTPPNGQPKSRESANPMRKATAATYQPGGLADVPLLAMQSYQPPTTRPSAARPDDTGEQPVDINYRIVGELKTEVSGLLEQKLMSLPEAQRHNNAHKEVLGKPIIDDVVARYASRQIGEAGHLWSPALEKAYRKAIRDSLFGAGRMQPLLEIEGAENIVINGHDCVQVQFNDGRVDTLPPVADSDGELMDQLVTMARNSQPKRAFDAANLDMTLMHGDQFRIHAISNDISWRPSVSIRQHLHRTISLGDEVDLKLMPLEIGYLLEAAVRAGLSIVVAGEVGVGKTVLLRALCDAVPRHERLATLETDMELFVHRMPGRANTLTLYERSGMGEVSADGSRRGEVGITEQVQMALRQQISRLIVGEVRGAEAAAMFQAMAIGSGTMSTIHARSVDEVPIRLAERVAQARVFSIAEAMRQVAQSIDLIIHVGLHDTGSGQKGSRRRFITAIDEISPGDKSGGQPAAHKLYRADRFGNPESINPSPAFLDFVQPWQRTDDLPRYGTPTTGRRS